VLPFSGGRWKTKKYYFTAFCKALAKMSKLQTFQLNCFAALDKYVGVNVSGLAALVQQYMHLWYLEIADNCFFQSAGTRMWDNEALLVAITPSVT
jgi:hypothetical protein